jgi:hypothetical protein
MHDRTIFNQHHDTRLTQSSPPILILIVIPIPSCFPQPSPNPSFPPPLFSTSLFPSSIDNRQRKHDFSDSPNLRPSSRLLDGRAPPLISSSPSPQNPPYSSRCSSSQHAPSQPVPLPVDAQLPEQRRPVAHWSSHAFRNEDSKLPG